MDGLAQDCSDPIVNSLELLQSCKNIETHTAHTIVSWPVLSHWNCGIMVDRGCEVDNPFVSLLLMGSSSHNDNTQWKRDGLVHKYTPTQTLLSIYCVISYESANGNIYIYLYIYNYVCWREGRLVLIPQAVMMTSSNGNIFRVTGPLCGEFTGPGEFPTQRPVTRSFDVFFDLRLNKRLSK